MIPYNAMKPPVKNLCQNAKVRQDLGKSPPRNAQEGIVLTQDSQHDVELTEVEDWHFGVKDVCRIT
jgi:hypothetical protein